MNQKIIYIDICKFIFVFCGFLLLTFGVHKGRKGNKYKWSWLCHFFPAVGKAEILPNTVSCAICFSYGTHIGIILICGFMIEFSEITLLALIIEPIKRAFFRTWALGRANKRDKKRQTVGKYKRKTVDSLRVSTRMKLQNLFTKNFLPEPRKRINRSNTSVELTFSNYCFASL